MQRQNPVKVYTDATPESIAIVIPSHNISKTLKFRQEYEVNLLEGVAALLGLNLALENFPNCSIDMYCHNLTCVYNFRRGKEKLFNYVIIRKLFVHCFSLNKSVVNELYPYGRKSRRRPFQGYTLNFRHFNGILTPAGAILGA